ncbi:MAG: hypothetical protein ACYC5Q_08660 [Thermoleophilia bacterium]
MAAETYDPADGARPVQRLIRKELQDRIALALLRGDICDGDTVRVEAEGLGLVVGTGGRAA